jgi:hypothetical protein
MNIDQVLIEAIKWTEDYRNKAKLEADEELQMLACAYSTLFLKACAKKSKNELAEAHEVIAECFQRLGDQHWSARHSKLAAAYKTVP